VINRPKQPFAFPFDRWMQEEWKDIFPERFKNIFKALVSSLEFGYIATLVARD
jgi:hypothetical protein